MERKLLSLPSFFVLLLVAGIAFLAAPVVDVDAAAPTVDTTKSAVTVVGTNIVFTIAFSQAVDYDSSATDDATHFGFQDLAVTDTKTGATATTLTLTAASISPAPADVLAGLVENQAFRVIVPRPTTGAGTVKVAILGTGGFVSVGTAPGAYVHKTPADSLSHTYDTVLPTVTIVTGAGVSGTSPNFAATGAFQVSFEINKALATGDAGFAEADITLTVGQPTPAVTPLVTASIAFLTKTQTASTEASATAEQKKEIWTAAINPGSGATSVKIEVKKDTVADAAGNKNAAAAPVTVSIDNVPPTVTITGPTAPEGGFAEAFKVTFVITDMLGGGDDAFQEKDITVTNGAVQTGSLGPDLLTAASDWTAMVTPDRKATPLTVTVDAGSIKDTAGNANTAISMDFTVNVPPPPVDPPDPTEPVQAGTNTATGFTVTLNVPSKGFVVLARSGDVAHHGILSGVTVIDIKDDAWEDLNAFMGIGPGGAIDLLAATTATDEDLVISEIMWGSDAGLGTTSEAMANSQWIELYNTTANTITGEWELRFTKSATGAGITNSRLSDKFTNFGLTQSNQFWAISDTAGGAYGQGGRTFSSAANQGTLRRLVSMERKIDFVKVEKTHDTNDAAKNRTTQLEGVPAGDLAGSWQASKDPQGANLTGRRLGTPGAKPFVTVSTTSISKAVVFNEVANRGEDKNDWLELYNPGSSEVKINNWVITKVTKVGTDEVLFKFESDENIVVPAKGFLLVVNEDPSETSLAAGENIDNPGSKANGLPTKFYINDKLKIPEKDYLLILRTEDKKGTDEKIVDIAGNIGAMNLSDTSFRTNLWPLKAWNAIKTDDLAQNNDKTWVRDKGKNLDHGDAWKADGGVTGLGIDRAATTRHSGTPGFDNGAIKDKVKDLKESDPVVISEIMFGTGDGRVPQWIELYNPSKTQAVKLNAWRLEVRNISDASEDLRVKLNYELRLPDVRIQPNQTVLIVSASGDTNDDKRFPKDRIINIWSTRSLRDAAEMSSRRDSVLSSIGFYLTLSDPDKTVVDEVGNLESNTRSNRPPTWLLKGGNLEDGGRSSMVRVEGTEGDGTEADAWRSAVNTFGGEIGVDTLYYGDNDDVGTPGYTPGGPLPVQLSSFYSKRNDAGAVIITWSTESELDNAGFNILRSLSRVGEFTRINAQLIPGAGTTGEKNTYTWTDTSARPNVVYYYQIEDVSLDGEHRTLRTTRLRGYVGAAGKATTIWGELKSRD